MPIDIKRINNDGKRKIGNFQFMMIQELTPKYLIEYAEKHHKPGKEGQTLLVIDECQILYNPREYMKNGRSEWVLFYSYHRHYGYDVILITQFDKLLDKQIKGMIENEYKHRKINNRGILFLLPVKIFAVIEYWYVNKTKIGAKFVRFKKKVSKIYNSYEANTVISEKLGVLTGNTSRSLDGAEEAKDEPTTRRRGRRPSLPNWWTKGLRTAALK